MYLYILFLLVLTSCYHKYASIPQIEGYVYNQETHEPEKNVKIKMQLVRHGGGEIWVESSLSDSLGFFKINKVEKAEFMVPGMESGERVPRLDSPVILEKEGFIPDSVNYGYKIRYMSDESYRIDTLFFNSGLK